MQFAEIAPYMILVIGMALTPGPNMMLYLTHTFEYGRKAGWATVAGITSAFIVHISATVLGLTALLIAVPLAHDALRYIGIAYLLWLAYKNTTVKEWKTATTDAQQKSFSHFYWKGLIGNVLNPQTTIMYFSLLPQFIHPERGNVLLQNLQLGGLQMLGSTVTNIIIVFFAGFASDAFFRNIKYQQYIRYTMSLFLAVFAIKLLFWK